MGSNQIANKLEHLPRDTGMFCLPKIICFLVQNCMLFNYVSLTGLDIDLTVSSSESRLVLERKRPNFSLWLRWQV